MGKGREKKTRKEGKRKKERKNTHQKDSMIWNLGQNERRSGRGRGSGRVGGGGEIAVYLQIPTSPPFYRFFSYELLSRPS